MPERESPDQYCTRCGKLGMAREFKGHECDPADVAEQTAAMREIDEWMALSPEEQFDHMTASLVAASEVARARAAEGESAVWLEAGGDDG